MGKLKVAVQFFGNLRTFKQCAPSLEKNLFNIYDCDVFMHTWESLDHSDKTWHKYKYKCKNSINIDTIEETLKETYPITRLKVDSQKNIPNKIDGEFKPYGKRTFSSFGVYSMIYSMSQANKLREDYQSETNAKYDYVIIIRPDLKLFKPIEIEKYTSNYSDEEINNTIFSAGTPSSNIMNDLKLIGCTDLIVFSKPETYSKIVSNFDKIRERLIEISGTKTNFAPEYLIPELAEKLNIKFLYVNYKTEREFSIVRPIKKLSLKRLISLKIKKHTIDLKIFPKMNRIIGFSFDLFGDKFTVNFSIGRRYE